MRKPKIRVEFEILSGIIRELPIGSGAMTPYSRIVVVAGDDGVATLKGVVRGKSDDLREEKQLIITLMRKAGFDSLQWHRYDINGKKKRTFNVNLNRAKKLHK